MREMQEFDRTPLIQVREFVIEQLKLNFAHDNLGEGEFEKRVETANAGNSKQDLLELVADLPRMEERTDQHPVKYAGGIAINKGEIQETANLGAVLGGTTRKGVWKPARFTRIFTLLGGTELDYSEAEMPPGVTEVDVFCVLGGTDITVPPGMKVETEVLPILGGVDNKARESGDPNAPILRIKGITVLGGVDVKTKKPKRRKK